MFANSREALSRQPSKQPETRPAAVGFAHASTDTSDFFGGVARGKSRDKSFCAQQGRSRKTGEWRAQPNKRTSVDVYEFDSCDAHPTQQTKVSLRKCALVSLGGATSASKCGVALKNVRNFEWLKFCFCFCLSI